jgi:hypothetical protein
MRISRTWIVLWSGLALGGAISIAATSSGNSSTARESYSERYSIVTENNIFMRDRHRRSGRYEPSTSPTTRPLEESLVLTGIVIEDQGLRAYVENTDTHEVTRLSPGDAVAHGKVDSIQIDAFDYLHNGEHSWIDVGSDLTGHAATLPETSSYYGSSSVSGGSSSSSTQPSGPPIDPNDPNLTLEQKMKLRRQQLLGPHQ